MEALQRATWLMFWFVVGLHITVCSGGLVRGEYDGHVVHEERYRLPRGWRKASRVHRTTNLPIRIGLTQSNLENAYDHLMEVSHPQSPKFGQHWTRAEVHDMYAPSEEAITGVLDWLHASGVQGVKQSESRAWLAFDVPAWQAEALFKTEYFEYKNGKKMKIGCDKYHLPANLTKHIDYIRPGVVLSPSVIRANNLVRKRKPRSTYQQNKIRRQRRTLKPLPYASSNASPYPILPPDLLDCGRNVTPACIKAIYQIPNATRHDRINALGIYETDGQVSQEDLNYFFTLYSPQIPNGTTPKYLSVDGGNTTLPAPDDYDNNNAESDLDLQPAYSIIYPQNIVVYQVEDPVQMWESDGFNTFFDALDGSYCNYSAFGVTGNTPGIDSVYPDPKKGGFKGDLMCGTYPPTKVITVSYGPSEIDLPLNYSWRQCNEFLKLGLQGITIVWASGDYGVTGGQSGNSSGCLGKNETVFNPPYPLCPYVTNVGGTRLYPNQTILDRESALQHHYIDTPLFASAGGFSNYFPLPEYQRSAVSKYFADHDPGYPSYEARYNCTNVTNIGENGGVYNRAGRGFPDVSALGSSIKIVNNLTIGSGDGTSLSAPIWGGIVTLINEERTAAGKGSVGFINPVLYEHPGVLNDIVNGSNSGCKSEGFKAVPGWDPITGLGTPNYPKLLKLFMGLP